MNGRQYYERCGLLTGVGGFVATIPTLVTLPGPTIVATLVTTSGLGVGAFGLLLLLVPLMPRWEEDDPSVRRVTRRDLQATYSFCGGVFGDNFSSFNSVKQWFRHNDKMFWIVEKTKRKGAISITEITGFYSILPLTKGGVTVLLEGQTDGRTLTTEHISTAFDGAAAYYIGAIASKGTKSKASALGSLITTVSQLMRDPPLPIYTRPTTRDGLRLARQRGFEAVDGSGTKDLNKLYKHEGDVL